MLDKINSTNTNIIYSRYTTPYYYTYYLNCNNKEESVKELIFNIEEILHKLNISIENCHLLIQSLYYLLQNCNIVVKYNINNIGNNINYSVNFNYIIILSNNTVLQFNINTIEKFLQGNELLHYLSNLNIKQDIPNQAIFISNRKNIDTQLIKSHKNCIPQLSDTSLISYSNLRNNLFESLGKMRSNNINKGSTSIKKNRKSKEKMLLRKRESLHYCTDSDLFIAKKLENNKCKNIKLSNKCDNLRRKSLRKRRSSHTNFKRLNNEIISKYYFFQKEKEQINYLISKSCTFDEKADKELLQSEKVKLKKIFKGKYFKNLYQKINIFQNNLKDYCNIENYEFKSEQGCMSSKIRNFGIKNTKPLFNNPPLKKIIPIAQSNLSEKASNTLNTSKNISSKNISSELLKPKIEKPITHSKSDLNQSLEVLKVSSLSLIKKNNEESCIEKDVKLNPVNNIIEKSNVLSSNEVVSLENTNPMMTNTSSRRNKRTKHNRSSAVCLSSNDIKDILDESKHNEASSNNTNNDKSKTIRYEVSKEQLERRKLLSRDYYHPSLSTLNSTQFCYNEYYPSIRLPSIQRNSQLLQQQWINNRRLNV
ncbi:hypothetical protein PIROE2DRAFT_4928 [Piromyces sp. E2]|nr:hypothetical protein PIROE2DRAFT_4928 [Piromyces sp. E2]|eukprot:OUM67637.1 hypothetical protein PIROE2DRAFT_4928 [Piromyces sp. E2]